MNKTLLHSQHPFQVSIFNPNSFECNLFYSFFFLEKMCPE